MKKLISVAFTFLFLTALAPTAFAAPIVIRLTDTLHQNFTGEFRNDDLAQELTPSGRLGQLVFIRENRSNIWVIDPALVDEVVVMTGGYKLTDNAVPVGKEIAISWLSQLKKISAGNDVVALAYGNPDVALTKSMAPSELNLYFSAGKTALEKILGRAVRSEPNVRWSVGKTNLNSTLRKDYGSDRIDITNLEKVVALPEVTQLRLRLARLLSPNLDTRDRQSFVINARMAVDAQLHKLRVNPGKYQITTQKAALPVTVINDFPIGVTINIGMVTTNARIIVDSFTNVKLAPSSKTQLELNTFVIAPGQTSVFAQINDLDGNTVIKPVVLALNATVIDPRLTWFTSGAAILLLLAAIAQSVRRVRKGRHSEI